MSKPRFAIDVRFVMWVAASVTFVVAIAVAPMATAAGHFPRSEPVGFTWGELAVLPEFCKDTQGTVWDTHGNGGPESPNLPKWLGLMGEDFFNLHHYCYGLRNILHAQSAGDATLQGKDLLRRALNEFSYVFRTCSPQMPLMPEIYLKQGEIYLKLGNLMEAKESFEQSRVLKPDYWPAYTRWIDVLVGLKQYDAARQLTKEGLLNSPNEPELINRLSMLEKTSRKVPGKLQGKARPNAKGPAAASQ